jgi:hypothetical protein
MTLGRRIRADRVGVASDIFLVLATNQTSGFFARKNPLTSMLIKGLEIGLLGKGIFDAP